MDVSEHEDDVILVDDNGVPIAGSLKSDVVASADSVSDAVPGVENARHVSEVDVSETNACTTVVEKALMLRIIDVNPEVPRRAQNSLVVAAMELDSIVGEALPVPLPEQEDMEELPRSQGSACVTCNVKHSCIGKVLPQDIRTAMRSANVEAGWFLLSTLHLKPWDGPARRMEKLQELHHEIVRSHRHRGRGSLSVSIAMVGLEDVELLLTCSCVFAINMVTQVMLTRLPQLIPMAGILAEPDWALEDGSFLESGKVRLRDILWPSWPPKLHVAVERF